MASLYIKDPETNDLATEVALLMGTSKTRAVNDALRRLKAELKPSVSRSDFKTRMASWRAANPLPPVTGKDADKEFYDWLSGEEHVHDPFR